MKHELILGTTRKGKGVRVLVGDNATIGQAKFSEVQLALLSTTAQPQQGTFKQAWTMTLMRRGHKCQLPRGFVKGNRTFINFKR